MYRAGKLCNRREGGREAQVSVTRITSVRECRAGVRYLYSGFLCKSVRFFCRVIRNVKRYEISALRFCPFRYAGGRKLFVKRVQNNVEFGFQYHTVKAHMVVYALRVCKILYVAELVYLIRAYGLHFDYLFGGLQVSVA